MPVQGATVTLEDSETGESFITITDADGVFFWMLNIPRIYDLGIEAEGYLPKKVPKDLVEEYAALEKIQIQRL